MSIREICEAGPVIPVIEIDQARHAKPLVEALLRGGISVVEITLRTREALDAISAVANISEVHVGAGTLVSTDDVKRAKDAGAAFGVSPGTTPKLIDACLQHELPFLPGAATPSEMINLFNHGFETQKFFPAEAAGGISMLKAVSGPLQNVSFCPTGGVSQANARDYLGLKNVRCVGGSWIAPRKLITEENWAQIENNARVSKAL